jgi:hypothetical protein
MKVNLKVKPLAYQLYWRQVPLPNYVHEPPC